MARVDKLDVRETKGLDAAQVSKAIDGAQDFEVRRYR